MRGFFCLVLLALGCGSDQFTGGDSGDAGGPVGEGGSATDSPSPIAQGCADGTREAFVDGNRFTNIAACSGGFSVPGTTTSASMAPMCNRGAGNTGPNPNGMGCSIEDLCAQGWHVCHGAMDVAISLPTGTTTCATMDQTTMGFWLTRQTTNATFGCSNVIGSNNNIVGCALGAGRMADATCAPLTHTMTYTECNVAPWQCSSMQTDSEATTITKSGPAIGGVMCCKG